MKFDKNFFSKQAFTPEQLLKFKTSAERDLFLSKENAHPEIKFHFAYMALIKIGIYLIAQSGYRVKSRPGHHQIIIEALGQLLGSKEAVVIGDKMRRSRNMDLYDAEGHYSPEEIKEYSGFIEKLLRDFTT